MATIDTYKAKFHWENSHGVKVGKGDSLNVGLPCGGWGG
jgi:hypothetical protein